jgi:hypothetical protein
MKKLVFCLLLSLISVSSFAWPTKEITLVVPFPSGGVADKLTRTVAADLEKKFSVPVVVKSGQFGSPVVATNQLVITENDNHTFMYALNDTIYSNMGAGNKNHEKLLATNIFATYSMVMYGNATASVDNLKKQIANGTLINVGNQSFNGQMHLWSINLTGLNVNAVSYKGGAAMATDVLGGSLEYGISSMGTLMPLVADKKIQPVMISGTKRLSHLPNVPTYLELGLRGEPFITWSGFVTRRDTSTEAIEKFSEAVRSVVTPNNPKWQEYVQLGFQLDNLSLNDSIKYYQNEIQNALKYKFVK